MDVIPARLALRVRKKEEEKKRWTACSQARRGKDERRTHFFPMTSENRENNEKNGTKTASRTGERLIAGWEFGLSVRANLCPSSLSAGHSPCFPSSSLLTSQSCTNACSCSLCCCHRNRCSSWYMMYMTEFCVAQVVCRRMRVRALVTRCPGNDEEFTYTGEKREQRKSCVSG